MKEKMVRFIAWHLPKEVVYWCAIRLFAHATMGKWGHQVVPELRAMDALTRWEEPNEGEPDEKETCHVSHE